MLLTFLASCGGALIGGLLGAFSGWVGARLTSRNARRDQVWKRVEWALSKVLDEDPKAQQLGSTALVEIIQGRLADKRDIGIIIALSSVVLDELEVTAEVDDADFILTLGDDAIGDTGSAERGTAGPPAGRGG